MDGSKGRCVVDLTPRAMISRAILAAGKVVIGHVLLESVHGDGTA